MAQPRRISCLLRFYPDANALILSGCGVMLVQQMEKVLSEEGIQADRQALALI
ncbi:MAG: hypothetical protein ACLUVV_00020 [Christensenellales bacterium]